MFDYSEMRKRQKHFAGRPSWYVREWLLHRSLRQADLVSRTDFTKSQVSEFVNGRHRFNADVLQAFADAIGVDAADLLRPPYSPDNELAAYVMRLDKSKRTRALRVLKAALGDEDEKVA